MVIKTLLRILLLPCLSCFASITVHAEDLVVFAAVDSVLQPGDIVKSDVMLSLRDGQSLTLIAKNGRIIRLQGTYRGQPLRNSGENTKELTDALKALVVSKSNPDDLGVTRDTSEIIANSLNNGWVPEPWVVDVSRNGVNCVQEGRPVVLWRANPTQESFKLTTGGQYRASTQWPKGENKIATPQDLPIINGERYHFALGSESFTTTWHVIPDGVDNANVVASWMLEVGCQAQATALLR